jgi:signal transduction histidine kinase/ActR/RegA family two-component response regulator
VPACCAWLIGPVNNHCFVLGAWVSLWPILPIDHENKTLTRKDEFAGSMVKWRIQKRFPLVIASFLAIVGSGFIPLYGLIENGAFVISSIFPFAAGWLLGMRGGLVYWFFHCLALMVLAPMVGSTPEDLRSSGLPMYAITFLLTAGIGKTRDIYKRLQQELEIRKRMEKELNDYKQGLEHLVRKRTEQLERVNDRLKQEIIHKEKAYRENRRLETDLKRAEKMEALGLLAGGVAHDLNNILSGILSYPELILLDMPENHPLRDPLLTIKKSGERAAAVVQDLLALARRGNFNTRVIDLNRTITDVVNSPECSTLRKALPGVSIVTSLAPDLPGIHGSTVHLSKAIMNLIANAAEAMAQGGQVTITTSEHHGQGPLEAGDYVTVAVSDTGDGIPEADLDKIFEPFFTSKKMGKSGTGIGLAVVWGTVKDHNGVVDVQSVEGKGTVFSLTFPATGQVLRSSETRPKWEDYKGNGEPVLVIDDVAEQRTISASILKKLGYTVATAESGEAALAYLREHSAELLVLDMVMEEGLDGFETYRRILDMRPGQKAVIVSGFAETERVKETQALGAGAFVRKPYTIETLGAALKAELDRESPS